MRIQLYQTQHVSFYLIVEIVYWAISNQYWWGATRPENWSLLHSPKCSGLLAGHLAGKTAWLTDYKSCWDFQSWWLPFAELVHTVTAPSLKPTYFLSTEWLGHQMPRYHKIFTILRMLCRLLSFALPQRAIHLMCKGLLHFKFKTCWWNSKHTAADRKKWHNYRLHFLSCITFSHI